MESNRPLQRIRAMVISKENKGGKNPWVGADQLGPVRKNKFGEVNRRKKVVLYFAE